MTTLNTAFMPKRCSNTVCPPTSSTDAVRKAIGRRRLWRMLPQKRSDKATTSRPKKLTGPTKAVAVAVKTAIQNRIHNISRR